MMDDNKPIKCPELVKEDVATFENTMQGFVPAGGPETSDSALKSDSLRILLCEIRKRML